MSTLHSVKKYFGLMFQILKAKLLSKNIPIRLDFNITKNCNLRCKYCYIDFNSLKTQKELKLQVIKKIISDWHDLGSRWIRLMGGEPLTRSDLGEIIDYCDSLGMIIEVNSNGYFLPSKIDVLKHADSVCLSIDGDEEATDYLRGKGCYKKVIEAIETGLENGLNIRIHCVLTKQTVNSLDHIAKLAKKYDIEFSFGHCMDNPEIKNRDMFLTNQEISDFYKTYRQYKKDGYPVANSYRTINALVNWPFGEKKIIYKSDKEQVGKLYKCECGKYSCFIECDGNVYACPTTWKNGINYFEHGAEKCWDYLRKNINCIVCNGPPKDFSMIINLEPIVIAEHIAVMLKRKLRRK